jgi:hypothetical protein
MSEHARLPPSGFSRWGTCHLSLDLEATMTDTPSAYAALGTALHGEAEKHLRAGTNTDPLAGQNAEIVQAYLDHVRAEARGGELLIEQKLKLDEDLWGTADAVIFVTKKVAE